MTPKEALAGLLAETISSAKREDPPGYQMPASALVWNLGDGTNAYFIPDEPGLYRIGIACTYFGTTTKYWDAEIVITASYDNQSGVLAWRLSGVAGDDIESARSPFPWTALVVGGMVAVGFAVAVVSSYRWRNRSRRLTTLSKETQ